MGIVSSRVVGRADFKTDCWPCVRAVRMGNDWVQEDSRIHARVLDLLLRAFDDTPVGKVIWMPAHKTVADIGGAVFSNGVLLSTMQSTATRVSTHPLRLRCLLAVALQVVYPPTSASPHSHACPRVRLPRAMPQCNHLLIPSN